MSFNFNNIKRRFLLQVIFFILFTLLAGGIIWFGASRTQKMNEIKNILTLINKNLVESYSSVADFQLNSDTDEDILTSGKNKYTTQFGSSLRIIRDTLTFLESSTILSHSQE